MGHHSKTWEPEPLRWLGVRGMYSAYKVADRHGRVEDRPHRPSPSWPTRSPGGPSRRMGITTAPGRCTAYMEGEIR